MKKYVLYSHGGSENHGCEALVRSTLSLLGAPKDAITVSSIRSEQDFAYGIDCLCKVIPEGSMTVPPKTSLRFWKGYRCLKIKKDHRLMDAFATAEAAGVRAGDVAMSVGGDNYCYDGFEFMFDTNRKWRDAGLKTVLWGCSMEPALLENPEVAEDVRQYSLITARETISYEALKKVNPNTILVTDSAFLLKKKELPLPKGLENREFVGINSSPLVEHCEETHGMARKNYEKLIEYILAQTDMSILLIPHVYWNFNDDRAVLRDLQERYADTGRVFLSPDGNCEEIKGYIARCRFFVGARTHATIAAYSTGVPTLVVGYSVKARGIARDLFGTEENYVLPVQSLTEETQLTKAFQWLQEHEASTQERLAEVLPEYIQRVYIGRDAVQKL